MSASEAIIPAYSATPTSSIPAIVSSLHSSFEAQTTKPLEFRRIQLRKLYWAIKDHTPALLAACMKDLHKGSFEAGLEVESCQNDCIYVCKKLEQWAKDERAPDIPLSSKLVSPKIRKDPLGVVLVIGTYNFPLMLLVLPMIGAIAAGNTVVMKPSENAPSVAAVLQQVFAASLDPSCYTTVQGAVTETSVLLDQKWDKIFYTGGANVAKIIARKAAETLTPYALELGGMNPAVVTKNANIKVAARRLLWGKVHNAGQLCISQNYTLVEDSVFDAYMTEIKAAMKEFFPAGTRTTEDYGRQVNLRAFQRVKGMLDKTRGEIVVGGYSDESDLYIEPTIIKVSSADDPLLQEESFGPLIPILSVPSLDAAINIAKTTQSTPLALYPFGNRAETTRMLQEIRSGGASINDSFMHGTIGTLPFGGVGESGQGAYKGKASFDCFTHQRSIVSTPTWLESLMTIRYPPYSGKLAKIKRMAALTPTFDREGREHAGGLLSYILTLGAGTSSGKWFKAILVLLTALGLRQYLSR